MEVMKQVNLEICCDASLKKFNSRGNRVFTCSGAICINTGEETYAISQDSTNNRGELLAIYLGIKLAESTISKYPNMYNKISIYSDSQFGILGIRDWMVNWVRNQDDNGVLYGSNNKPVKNQNMFKMIITYCVTRNLVVHFYNQKGHVNVNSQRDLALANRQFYDANGYYLKPEDIFKISFYNDIVDKNSRNMLDGINPDTYPVFNYNDNNDTMCRYIIPSNFKDYIK